MCRRGWAASSRGEPGAGLVALHDDRERAVRCSVQAGGAVADRVAVDRILDQIEVGRVVHRHRPECPTGGGVGKRSS